MIIEKDHSRTLEKLCILKLIGDRFIRTRFHLDLHRNLPNFFLARRTFSLLYYSKYEIIITTYCNILLYYLKYEIIITTYYYNILLYLKCEIIITIHY